MSVPDGVWMAIHTKDTYRREGERREEEKARGGEGEERREDGSCNVVLAL